MNDASVKDVFLASLSRCTQWTGFIPAFYDRFLASSDDVRARFRNTDFDRQNRMLLRSLELAAAATAGEPEGLREIRERAATHDRFHLDIRPPLYDLWLSAIVRTARDFDGEWNDDVEKAWWRILGLVVQFMIRRY